MNYIEEDIKNAEHFIKSIKTDKEYKEENGWHGYYNKEIVELARMLEHILSDYKRALNENIRLRNIRNEYKYGIENTHLITKSDLVQIDINKYMIEIENGRFVDLKQVYQENVKLKKENEELKKFHIQDNKHLDFIMKNSIPVEKVKDKIEKEIKYHEKNILDIENITMLKGKTAKEEAEIEFNKYAIVVLKKMLQELLESEE